MATVAAKVAAALLLLSMPASIHAQSASAVSTVEQQHELSSMFQGALTEAREMAVDTGRASPAAQRQRRLNEWGSSGNKPVPTWDKNSCEVSHTTHCTRPRAVAWWEGRGHAYGHRPCPTVPAPPSLPTDAVACVRPTPRALLFYATQPSPTPLSLSRTRTHTHAHAHARTPYCLALGDHG